MDVGPILTHNHRSFQTPGPEVGTVPIPVTSNLQICWGPLLQGSKEEGKVV